MDNLKKIITNEAARVLSDHSILLTVIIAPLLYAFFLGSIYLNKDIEQIRFAVVDYDNTPTSRELTRLLSASPKIDMAGYLEDYNDGVEKLQNLEISGFLIFSKGMERKLMRLEAFEADLYLNTTRFLPSNDLNMAVNEVLLTAGAGVRLRYLEAGGMTPAMAMQRVNPVNVEVKPIYNDINSYGNFLLPGLFFLILQQTLLLGMGESVGRDAEHGDMGSWLAKGKHGVVNYMAGKSVYYFVLYAAYLFFFVAIVFPFFDLPVGHAFVDLAVITMTFFAVVMVLAMLIGTFVRSQIRMMELLAFTSYPFFLLSGYSWPLTVMPLPLQWLAAAIPTTPMMQAMSRLMAMNGDAGMAMDQWIHLLIQLAVGLLLLIWRLWYLKSKSSPSHALSY